MLTRLKAVADGSLILLELRAVRQELAGLRAATDSIASTLARLVPPAPDPAQMESGLTIAYVDSAYQAEVMDIELRLTRARGVPPTEDEVLEEYERRHPPEETGQIVGVP